MSSTREAKVAAVKERMGASWVGHPEYDSKKTPWHNAGNKTSHTLARVRQEAIKAGRL